MNIVMNGIDLGRLSEVLLILLVMFFISHFYNQKITAAGNRIEGFDWLLVVIGVFYTQIGIGLLDLILPWNSFFLGLMAYSFSGLPMMCGAYQRHQEAQERARKALNE